MRNTAATCELEVEELECRHCEVRMTSHEGGGGTVRYYHCPSCSRWASTMYREVLCADTRIRRATQARAVRPVEGTVKERLARWLEGLTAATS